MPICSFAKNEFSYSELIFSGFRNAGIYFTGVAEVNLPLDEQNQNPGRSQEK
jgi:hypothetical protein